MEDHAAAMLVATRRGPARAASKTEWSSAGGKGDDAGADDERVARCCYCLPALNGQSGWQRARLGRHRYAMLSNVVPFVTGKQLTIATSQPTPCCRCGTSPIDRTVTVSRETCSELPLWNSMRAESRGDTTNPPVSGPTTPAHCTQVPQLSDRTVSLSRSVSLVSDGR